MTPGLNAAELSGSHGRESWGIDAALILALAIVVMVPGFFVSGAYTGDAQTHWLWQQSFSHQFWAGEFLPRWLHETNEGFGSPAFFIYPPVTHWLAAFSAILFPDDLQIHHRFTAVMILFMFLSGIGARAWCKTFVQTRLAALIGASLYMLLPYHLYVNTYQRGAVAELAAMAWIPWIFTGIRRVADARAPQMGFVLPSFLLLISHAPSAVFVTPAAALYAAWLSWEARSVRLLMIYAACAACSALLAGFYLVPALIEIRNVAETTLFDAYFHPSRWLLFRYPWPDQGMLLVIGANVLIYYGIAILALSVAVFFGSQFQKRQAVAYFAALSLLLFFLTPVLAPFWNLNTFANKIQFPWRLLALGTFYLATISAIATDSTLIKLVGRRNTYAQVALGIGLLLFLPLNGLMLSARLEKARSENRAPPTIAQTLADRRGQFDYRPGDLDKAHKFFGSNDFRTWPLVDAKLRWTNSREATLSADFTARTTIALRQFQYTGWQVFVDGRPQGLSRPLNNNVAVASANVSSGRHDVAFRLVTRPTEKVGIILSGIGLVLMSVFVAFGHLIRRREVARFTLDRSALSSA